jgi:hypothetical protein
VPVTVTDSAGRFVSGLAAEQFELTDAGERRAITQFTTERVPVSLGILLDISGSMATDPKARAADDARWADTRRALELLVQRLDPRDEVFFAAFADKIWLAVPWTRDHQQVPRAFNTLKPSGFTAMFDAVKLISPAFQRAEYGRKVLLVITDGRDSLVPKIRGNPPPVFRGGTREQQVQAEIYSRQKTLRDVAIGATQRAVTNSGAAVYASADFGSLADWPIRFVQFGPSISMPVFQGGRNKANLKADEARYEQATATYRGTILNAFREVGDALSALSTLAAPGEAVDRALVAARDTVALANERYQTGLTSYLDVGDAQRAALQALGRP